MPTVERRKVPRYRILTGIGSQALRGADAIISDTLANVRRVLEASRVDPNDSSLITPEKPADPNAPLRKTPLITEDERFDKSLAAFTHAQREKHGAPNPLTVLPHQLVERLLASIPFQSGKLFPNTATALLPEREVKFQLKLMPLTVVVNYSEPIESIRLREVLRGDRVETPKLIKHPGFDVFTIVGGSTTWLAASMLGLESLQVQVSRPRKVVSVTPADGPIFPFDDLIELVQNLTRAHTYILPPALERLGAVARSTDRDIFQHIMTDVPHPEEALALARAVRITSMKIDLIHEVEHAESVAGTLPSRLRGVAMANPAVVKLLRLEASADRILRNVQNRFENLRQERRDAMLEGAFLAEKEFAAFASVWIERPFILWNEANKPLTLDELGDGHVAGR